MGGENNFKFRTDSFLRNIFTFILYRTVINRGKMLTVFIVSAEKDTILVVVYHLPCITVSHGIGNPSRSFLLASHNPTLLPADPLFLVS